MECDCLAVMEPSAFTDEDGAWLLDLSMHVREAGDGEMHGGARAKVTYEWGNDVSGWATAVTWPQGSECSHDDMEHDGD